MSNYSEQFLKQKSAGCIRGIATCKKARCRCASAGQTISSSARSRMLLQRGWSLTRAAVSMKNRTALRAEKISVMQKRTAQKWNFGLGCARSWSEYGGLPAFVTPLPANSLVCSAP